MPPPGAAFTTVIDSVPAVVESKAGMTAVNWVELTKVVVSAVPLKSAVEPLTKLVPVSVMVVFALPMTVEAGLMLVSVGTGLLTVSVCAAEVPPPGVAFTTVIDSLPAVVRSVGGMTAVNWVALTNVVVGAVPLKSAVEPLTKLVPVSVMVVALPTNVEAGLMLVSVGAGLVGVMVNVFAVEVPPPGAAFTTVIDAVPAVGKSV